MYAEEGVSEGGEEERRNLLMRKGTEDNYSLMEECCE